MSVGGKLPSERRGAASERAFTLMEVIIALGILALAAVVLGAAYVNVLISYQSANRDSMADEDYRFARAQLLATADREKAEEGLSFDGIEGRRITWKAEIEETNLPDLFDVRFTCEQSSLSGGGTTTETEQFRVLRPTWSESQKREVLREATQKRIRELNLKASRP